MQRFFLRVALQLAKRTTATRRTQQVRKMDDIRLLLSVNLNVFLEQTTIRDTILLIAAFAGWVAAAFPLLKHAIYFIEGKKNWRVLGWFLLVYLCIYVFTAALSRLLGWPQLPGWSGKFFMLGMLLCTVAIPFAVEYTKAFFKKDN